MQWQGEGVKPGTTSWARLVDRGDQATRRPSRGRTRRAAALAGTAALVLAAAVACGSGPDKGAPASNIPAHVTLATATAPFGTYLTDSAGRALYMWDADRGGTPTCYGACAEMWPPVTVSESVTAGAGVRPSLVSEVKRTDGTEQVTYGGWPLYFFRPDVRAGELTGQGNTGFGAVWWVVAPDGTPLPSEPQR